MYIFFIYLEANDSQTIPTADQPTQPQDKHKYSKSNTCNEHQSNTEILRPVEQVPKESHLNEAVKRVSLVVPQCPNINGPNKRNSCPVVSDLVKTDNMSRLEARSSLSVSTTYPYSSSTHVPPCPEETEICKSDLPSLTKEEFFKDRNYVHTKSEGQHIDKYGVSYSQTRPNATHSGTQSAEQTKLSGYIKESTFGAEPDSVVKTEIKHMFQAVLLPGCENDPENQIQTLQCHVNDFESEKKKTDTDVESQPFDGQSTPDSSNTSSICLPVISNDYFNDGSKPLKELKHLMVNDNGSSSHKLETTEDQPFLIGKCENCEHKENSVIGTDSSTQTTLPRDKGKEKPNTDSCTQTTLPRANTKSSSTSCSDNTTQTSLPRQKRDSSSTGFSRLDANQGLKPVARVTPNNMQANITADSDSEGMGHVIIVYFIIVFYQFLKEKKQHLQILNCGYIDYLFRIITFT